MKRLHQSAIFIFLALSAFSLSAQSEVKSIQINFAMWGQNYDGWNKSVNVDPFAESLVLPGPLSDIEGESHAISISIGGSFSGPNYGGMTDGVYPSDVMKRGYYVDNNDVGIIYINGLEVDKKYSITCFGSRNGYNNEDYTTIFTDITHSPIYGASGSIQSYQNTSNTVELTNLTANAEGQLRISVKKGVGAIAGYVNAIVLQFYEIDKPDLTFSNSLISPTALRPGEQLSTELTIQNTGTLTSEASEVSYYLSRDKILNDEDNYYWDEFLGKESFDKLEPGASISIARDIEIPALSELWSFYILQVIDKDGHIDEFDEENNVVASAIFILKPPTVRYVSATGTDATGDGSLANPYGTPQFAIDMANPKDVVHLLAGEYYLPDGLELKSDITFRGDGPDKTKIIRWEEDNLRPILHLRDANNVIIENLRFEASYQYGAEHLGVEAWGVDNLQVRNCIFNTFTIAIELFGVQNYQFENCTFIGEFTEERSEKLLHSWGILESRESSGTVRNSIFLNFIDPVSGPDISYNNGITSALTGVNGNINVDPDFVDIENGDFQLNPDSPCIDAGDPNSPPDPDGSRADMGALPFTPKILYVSTTGSDETGDGTRENPFKSPQVAVDLAGYKDIVHILAGTYTIYDTLKLKSNITLRGDGAVNTKINRKYYVSDKYYSILLLDSVENVSIEDLRISTPSDNVNTGIDIQGGKNITINRCVIVNMTRGIYFKNCENYLVENCTIGTEIGGSNFHEEEVGLYEENCSGSKVVRNTILWQSPSVKIIKPVSYTEFYYNNGIVELAGTNGNISDYNEFVDIYSLDYRLEPDSPCINAGDPNSPLDPDGTRADMGAIPYHFPKTIYVSTDGSDENGNGTREKPFRSPQLAIDLASKADTVHLLTGNYIIDDTIKLKSDITFRGDGPGRTKLDHDFMLYEDFVYLYMEDVENVHINNLYLRLSGPIVDNEISTGIQVEGGQDVHVSRCALFNGVKGIVFNDVENYSVIHCTIVGYIGGGGLGNVFESNCSGNRVIKNNIFALYAPLIIENPSGEVQFSYNAVEYGEYVGINGNIFDNSVYADIYRGYLQLKPGSNGIDAGDPDSPLDPDGTRADMGAFYYRQPLNVSVQTKMVSCALGNDGEIELNIRGGLPPYTIAWSNGSASEDLSGLEAGIYSVTVTDNSGEKIERNYELVSPAPLQIQASLTKPACEAGEIGEVSLDIVGGYGPYEYQIDNAANIPLEQEKSVISKFIGGSIDARDLIYDIHTDGSGNVYLFGSSDGEFELGDIHLSEGSFMIKFDPSLTPIWGKNISFARTYAVDKDGNIYIKGSQLKKYDTNGDLVFEKQISGFTLDVDGFGNIYLVTNKALVKLDDSGDILWEKELILEDPRDATITVGTNEIVVCNGTWGNGAYQVQIGGNVIDINETCLIKFTLNGELEWLFTPIEIRGALNPFIRDVEIDGNGNIYALGGAFGFDENTAIVYFDKTHLLTSTWSSDIGFLAKFDPDGNVSWLNQLYSSSQSDVKSLSLNPLGDIAITFHFFGGRTIEFYNPEGELKDELVSSEEFNYENYLLNANYDYSGNLLVSGNFYGQVSFDGTDFVTENEDSDFFVFKYGYENQVNGLELEYGQKTITVTDAFGCSADTIIDVDQGAIPATPEICIITQDELTTGNKIVWEIPSDLFDRSYLVYRENDYEGDFIQIATMDLPATGVFIDNSVNTEERSYRYKIALAGECPGNISELSPSHKSAHLTINRGYNDEVNLIWENYEGMEYSTNRLLRGANRDNMHLLVEVPGSLTSYTDLNPSGIETYYQLEVVGEGICGEQLSSGRSAGIQRVSRSNIVTINDGDPKLSIYPVPATSILNIYWGIADRRERIEVKITDSNGKIVFHRSGATLDELNLDVTHLRSGLYFVHLGSEKNTALGKFIKN